jgi:type II secretory pathway pseudopilin PulG
MSQYDPQLATPRRGLSPWAIVLLVLAGCGVLMTVIIAILAAILFPVFAQAREAARKAACRSNQKQIATAIQMYHLDHGVLPAAASWQTDITPYLGDPKVFTCPSRPGVLNAYAYNAALQRRDLAKFADPSVTPMVFESSAGAANAADRLESFATPHRGEGIVVFADGETESVTAPPNPHAGIGAEAEPAE